jgi:hypothetical protein
LFLLAESGLPARFPGKTIPRLAGFHSKVLCHLTSLRFFFLMSVY